MYIIHSLLSCDARQPGCSVPIPHDGQSLAMSRRILLLHRCSFA